MAASHTRGCPHTHAVVTAPAGLLLRALVCCRIHAPKRNFKTYFRNPCRWFHVFMCSMWPLSLEEGLLSGMAPSDSGGLLVPSSGREYTMEIRGRLQEESRAELNWLVLLLLDHSYRSAQLTSPSCSPRQWLPTGAPTQSQFCILIFLRVSGS